MGSTVFRLGKWMFFFFTCIEKSDFVFYIRCKVFDPRPCWIRAQNDTNKCCPHTLRDWNACCRMKEGSDNSRIFLPHWCPPGAIYSDLFHHKFGDQLQVYSMNIRETLPHSPYRAGWPARHIKMESLLHLTGLVWQESCVSLKVTHYLIS